MMFRILSEGFQKCTFTFFHGHWHLEYNDMLSPPLVYEHCKTAFDFNNFYFFYALVVSTIEFSTIFITRLILK